MPFTNVEPVTTLEGRWFSPLLGIVNIRALDKGMYLVACIKDEYHKVFKSEIELLGWLIIWEFGPLEHQHLVLIIIEET